MRHFVFALALCGCSWASASRTNDPATGCSRRVGRVDAALALAGLAATIAVIAVHAADPPPPEHEFEPVKNTALAVTALSGFSMLEGVQALYGLGVADRCQAARSR